MSSRNSNPFSESLEVTDPEEISSESESFESEEDESLSSESEGTSSDDSDGDDDDSNDEDRDVSDDESDSEDDDDDSSSSSSSGDSSGSEFDEEDNIDKEVFYDEDGKRLNRSTSPTSFRDRIKKIHIILLSVGCLLFLVIVIALGVGLGLKGDKEDASTNPASAPSPSITFRPTRQGEPTRISLNDDDSNGDIPGTAIDAGIFNTLVAALGAADLVDVLSEPNGPYTVFAPTDDAFAALPEELVPCLLRSKNKGALTNILLYHVVDGQVLSTDLSNGLEAPTLLEGEDVTVDLTDGVKINDSTVIKADVLTSNGVIHVIDAVLVPPSIDVAEFLETSCGALDIPETAVDAGIFNTLVAALGAADLVDALSEPNGPYTVFAPTDDAFAALPEELVPCLLRSKNKGALTNILLYHVVDGQVLSTDLSNGLEAPTLLEGEDVTVDLTDGVKINDSTVIKADVLTSNGVIHVIDAVLVPPSIDVAAFLKTSCGALDIPETAVDAGIFNTLVAALGAADLVDALSEPNGPYTVFAPTDDAFAALPEELVPCLLRSKNKGALTNILLYHVVDGQVLSTDLSNGLEAPTLLEGEDVTVDLTDGVKINDSTVIKADVLTSNGVIHVIDAVLVPPSIDVAAFLSTCDVPARGDVELTVLSNADTTIYRDGLFQDSVNGNDNTMLIQNGPPGDLELASAYSLVELSFNANEIENLKNANAEFCLDHVINDKPADRVITYSTCLLIPLSDGSVDAMTGATSSYVMPDDCVGNKVVGFDVRPFDTTICVDVTPLLFGSNDRTIRRSLQEEKSLIMMIDNLVESDEPGDRFYTSNDETKSPPTLVIEGKGTVQDIDDNIDDDDDDDDDDDNNEEECQTIAEIACSAPAFTTLCELVVEAGLAEALDTGTFTVFAPKNNAFTRIPPILANELSNTDVLKNLLLFHTVADEEIFAEDLVCDGQVTMTNLESTTTACDDDNNFFQVGGGNQPESLPRIVDADIVACNGVIHVVNEVLLPEIECESIYDIACSSDDFSTLCSLIENVELDQALSDQIFTVFAPTDDAFANILDNVDASDQAFVKDLLLYHTVPARIISADDIVCDESLTMGNGKATTTQCDGDDLFQVGNGNLPDALPQITTTDIRACNGIIHVVNEVILPLDSDGDDNCETFGTVVCATPGLEELCRYIGFVASFDGAALIESLNSDTFTVFAPNNNAFEKIPSNVDLSDIDTLIDVLLYHAVPETELFSEDLIPFCDNGVFMANNEDVTIQCTSTNTGDNIFVVGSGNTESRPKVVKVDIPTCTGVVHIVNQVILSENLEEDLSTSVPSGSSSGDDVFVSDSTETVVDIAVSDPDTFSSLVNFATLADLVDTLSTTNDITLFAPTNDAFTALAKAAPDVVSNLQTEEWQDHLEDLLFYHVLPDVIRSSAITNGLSATTLNTEDIDFTITTRNGGGIFVNDGAEVVAADVDAKNGVIHVIDNVLLPSWVSNSIVDLAKATSDLSTLVDLVVQAELVDTLSEAGPYTVFAPTNEAFAELLDGGTSLSAGQVASVLTYHVVEGIYTEDALVDGLILTTLQGDKLTLSSQGKNEFVNDEKIIIPNILANNGIIHVIGGVLTPEGDGVNEETTETVVDIAVGDPDTFSSLVDFVTQADLVDTLSDAIDITLFAPTNDAFAALSKAAPDVVSNLQTEEWQDHLVNLLLYHVLPVEVPSSAVTDSLSATTLNAEDIDFTVTNGGGIFVNEGAEVVAADVDAKNGVIHVIDNVLLPSWVSNSIVDLAKATSDLSTLVDLVVQAELVDTLSEAGPYTVFAPTNEAFAELLDDGASLSAGQVASVLTYHVVEGIYPESALVDGLALTTLQGEELIFRSRFSGKSVNDERIIIPNILANNGIVHVIGGVLIPEEISETVPPSDSSTSLDSSVESGTSETVVDIAVGDPGTFSSLVDFVTQADLVDTLSTTNDITLFAPTNDAFTALSEAAPDVVSNLQTEEWQDHLVNLLLYHVLPVEVPSSAVTNGLSATTLNTEDIDFTITTRNGGGIFVNDGAEVVAADVDAKNGVIHVIDNVLLPSWVSNSIVDLAKATSDLSTLVDLVVQAELVDTLSEAGPYTVFAPTNEAFAELLDDGTSLSADQVASVLTYHVVEGIYTEDALVDGLALTTLQGEELVFRGIGNRVFANDERIIIPNILANNGIVHVIKGVLIPEESGIEQVSDADSDDDSAVVETTQPTDTIPPTEEGEFTPCSICLSLDTELRFDFDFIPLDVIPDAAVTVLPIEAGKTIIRCDVVDDFCRSGNCGAEICSSLADIGNQICGCNLLF